MWLKESTFFTASSLLAEFQKWESFQWLCLRGFPFGGMQDLCLGFYIYYWQKRENLSWVYRKCVCISNYCLRGIKLWGILIGHMYISAIDIRTKVSYVFFAWETHIILRESYSWKKNCMYTYVFICITESLCGINTTEINIIFVNQLHFNKIKIFF